MTKLDLINRIKREEAIKKHEEQMELAKKIIREEEKGEWRTIRFIKLG